MNPHSHALKKAIYHFLDELLKKNLTHREKTVELNKQNVSPSANIFQGFRNNIFLICLCL